MFSSFFLGYAFPKKTWSGLHFDVLGPENSDSSSKTTYIVLFPGLNSSIQVKIPQLLFCSITFQVLKRRFLALARGPGGFRVKPYNTLVTT